MRDWAALLLLCSTALAQPAQKIEYTCPASDIESFGLACSSEDPCAVFLELSAVETAGSRLFLAGNLHTQSSTLYAVMLSSDDGGKSWMEAADRIRAASFEQLQFLDANTGWASGQLIEPLPRDPFLLGTTDGGKTWTSHPIFEESRGGTVSQFWFSSATDGEIVIDRPEHGVVRHEVLATKTAGANWDPKESTTKPVSLKSVKDATWRIRADSASKSYHLEHLAQPNRWQPVAVFAIHVADCK